MTADESAEGETESGWAVEAELEPGLLRVSREGESRWFVRIGGGHADPVLAAEAAVWPGVRRMTAAPGPGLLVPRCRGGLLTHALRAHGGLPAAQALGVLEEAVEAVLAAPRTAAGWTRMTSGALALTESGRIAVVPGRLRAEAETTDSAACGEILHAALTGGPWSGRPLAETAPAAPAAVRRLTEHLLAGTPAAGLRTVLRRVRELDPQRERGFLPAEAGVAAEDAPTGVLDGQIVSHLRGARAGEGGHCSTRKDARTRSRSGPPARSLPSGRLRAVGAAGASAAVLLAGAWLLAPGMRGETSRTEGPGQTTAVPHAASSAEGDAASGADPAAAFAALTRERSAAVAAGDREALMALTVPGSPAAQADVDAAPLPCQDCGELAVDDIRILDDSEPGAAVLRARMRAGDGDWSEITIELREGEVGWQVHSVHG